MHHLTLPRIVFLAMATSPTAWAITYVGNPTLTIEVEDLYASLDDGSVDLGTLRVYNCSSGYTDYVIDATIDPVAGWSKEITGGDLCGARLYWDTKMVLNGEDGNGNGYSLEYDEAHTDITFDAPIPTVSLSSYTVTSGSYPGPAPRIATTVVSD